MGSRMEEGVKVVEREDGMGGGGCLVRLSNLANRADQPDQISTA